MRLEMSRTARTLLPLVFGAITSALVGLTLTSCTPRGKQDTSSVRISFRGFGTLPSPTSKTQNSLATTDGWGQSDPTSISEFNCFGIAVDAPETFPYGGVCSKADGTKAFKYILMRGAFPSGATIQLEVPSGPSRTIRAIGFKASSSASCVNFATSGGPNKAELSAPFVIAATTVDLVPGDSEVRLNAAFDVSARFEKCDAMVPIGIAPTPAPGTVSISPDMKTIPNSGNILLVASGGTAPYTFSLQSGGGSVNALTGVYTAPGTDGQAVVLATDSLGQTALATVRHVTVGALDAGFGTSGIVIQDFGIGEIEAYDVKVQLDGKIVVVGRAKPSTDNNLMIARFNADGTPDLCFGDATPPCDTGGAVVLDGGYGLDDRFNAVAIQGDGKLVAVGYRTNSSSKTDGIIARFNPDGSVDASYNLNVAGVGQYIDINGHNEAFNAVRAQVGGKVVVAGYMTDSTNADKELLFGRLNVDGTADTSFAGTGFGTNFLTSNHDVITSIAIHPLTGNIDFGGYSEATSTSSEMKVLRYDSGGNLVTTFATNGVYTHVESAGGYFTGWAKTVKLTVDGGLLMAGYRYDGNFDGVIVKVKADGSGLDTAFGTNGVVNSYYNSNNDMIFDMVVQKDGKIVVAGNKLSTDNNWMIARYSSSGALDTTFDSHGNGDREPDTVNTNNWDRLFGIALNLQGFVIAAGYANSSSGVLDGVTTDIGLVRILNDGN